MQLQGTTIPVSNLANAKNFYEEILGFEPDIFHEPTKWQSYKFEGRSYYAIIEEENYKNQSSKHIVNFDVKDIETYRERIRDQVTVEQELSTTPRGSKKFVIKDMDGNRLGFVLKS